MVFEQGYLIYRIRAIGMHSNSLGSNTYEWEELVSDWTMPNVPLNATVSCNGLVDLTVNYTNSCPERYIKINNGLILQIDV